MNFLLKREKDAGFAEKNPLNWKHTSFGSMMTLNTFRD